MTSFLSDDVSFKIFLSHESESLRRFTLVLEDFLTLTVKMFQFSMLAAKFLALQTVVNRGEWL